MLSIYNMNTKNEKIKVSKNLVRGMGRVIRWLICQKIGVAFFESGLSDERLEQIRDVFMVSDFLKDEVFFPTIK